MKRDETHRNHTLIGVLGITVLALLMLVSTADAAQYTYISNCESNTVSVIDTATDTITTNVTVGNMPRGSAASPDGTKVYVTNFNSDNVSVIDTEINKVTATIDVGSSPASIAITPDGKRAYLTQAALNSNVYVIDTVQNKILTTMYLGGMLQGLVVNSEGTKVYVTNRGSHNISVIDTATNTVLKTVDVGTPSCRVAVSPDGTKIYVTNVENDTVSVIDTVTDTVKSNVNVGDGPFGVAVNPDGTKVYVTNVLSNTVSVIDTATNTIEATVNVGNGPYEVSVTPDGKKVYVANKNSNNVSVIDTATNTITASVNVGISPFGIAIISKVPRLILPAANFSTNVTSGYVPLSVQFTDLSENETSRYWDFENDENIDSTEETPVHVYSIPGTYTAKLTVINVNGTDEKTTTITVLEQPVPPIADFSASPTIGKAPLTVTFVDKSTGSPTSWSWKFGDKSTSTDQSPVYTYNKAGKYTVSLTVKNELGSNTRKISSYIIVKK